MSPKKVFQYLLAIRKLWSKDRKRTFTVSLRNRFPCWKAGFLPESYVIYGFSENRRDHYLSDFARIIKTVHVHSRSSVLDDKLIFNDCFNYTNKLISPIAYLNKGLIIDITSGRHIQLRELKERILSKECVLKPAGGGGGNGIRFVSFKDDWNVDGEKKTEEFIDKLVTKASNVLLYPRIWQTGFANEINPNSLNTIRLVTMIDPENGEAFIPIAVFRCGSKQSGQVDNWSNGGFSALIDRETGIISKAAKFPKNGTLKWIDRHPDTNHLITGFQIPGWSIIKSEMLTIAQKNSFLPYVGWDIVPMQEDFLILEGNSNSDVNLLQVHKPLLKDPRVQNFFKYYKVI